MEGRFPLKSKGFEWTKNEQGYALLDKGQNKTVQIDPITFLVWVQCDGRTSVETIIDVFTVDGNRDIIKAAITGVLEKLTTDNLIEWV